MSTNDKQYTIEEYKLNYRACIPFYILLDPDLSFNELRLYGLIEQMESSMKDVFVSDRKFAEILGISHQSKKIQAMKRKLMKKNYIKRELRIVTIGKRKAEMHCWNTVKGLLIEDNTGSVPDGHHQEENNTAGVPQGHPPGVPQGHLCNTLKVKSHKSITTTTGQPPDTHQKSVLDPVVVVVLNSQTITNKLTTAFRMNPVKTKNIKNENDFLYACEYSIIHRNDGNNGEPYSEEERVRGIVKLVKEGNFEDPKGWAKQKPANKDKIAERLKAQEEASLLKWKEEEKARQIKRKQKIETPVTIDAIEHKGVKRLGMVLAGLPMLK